MFPPLASVLKSKEPGWHVASRGLVVQITSGFGLPQDLRSSLTLDEHAKAVSHLTQHDRQQPCPSADQALLCYS